jgi:RNA polymerase sigma-70 factor (ECF subfamily)
MLGAQAGLGGVDLSEAALERELVQACQAGDHQAFMQIYRTHRRDVACAIYNYTGSAEDLEALIQEVFLEVSRSIPRFKGRPKLANWIHGFAIDVTIRHIRKKHRSNGQEISSIGPLSIPVEKGVLQRKIPVFNRLETGRVD